MSTGVVVSVMLIGRAIADVDDVAIVRSRVSVGGGVCGIVMVIVIGICGVGVS